MNGCPGEGNCRPTRSWIRMGTYQLVRTRQFKRKIAVYFCVRKGMWCLFSGALPYLYTLHPQLIFHIPTLHLSLLDPAKCALRHFLRGFICALPVNLLPVVMRNGFPIIMAMVVPGSPESPSLARSQAYSHHCLQPAGKG